MEKIISSGQASWKEFGAVAGGKVIQNHKYKVKIFPQREKCQAYFLLRKTPKNSQNIMLSLQKEFTHGDQAENPAQS